MKSTQAMLLTQLLSLAAPSAQAGNAFTLTDVCQLPPLSGPCEAYMPRWFHNAETDRCEPFIYGGCRGNGNNFRTQQDCEAACPTQKIPCGGFAGLGCPSNLVCVDDPGDDCDPAHGGADCLGMCVSAPQPKVYCLSSDSCKPDEFCTTEDGVCLKNPRMPALTVCWGLCEPRAVL